MKRVYLIFTLFITSFFLLSSNVKANTITFNVKESEMSYMTNENFLFLREKTIEYCKENNMYYVISTLDGYSFSSSIFEYIELKGNINTSSNILYITPKISFNTYQIFNGVFSQVGSGLSSIGFGPSGNFTYKNLLDTNLENLIYVGTEEFIFQYNDLSLIITNGSRFPTLYDVYLDYKKLSEVPQENPKSEIVTNFYILVIDKIKLLTDYIATDYIILSALVIFIFVAVIGLVRRLE